MGRSSRPPHGPQAPIGFILGMLAASGALGDPPAEKPTGSFLSSLKQAINKDFDHEVVRGHFDVGAPPDAHRYFCLLDAKTGKSETNGVAGQPFVRPDGMTGLKGGAVSFYSCANAEQGGLLVTTGYTLNGAAAANSAAPAKRPADVPATGSAFPDKNALPDKNASPGASVSAAAIDVAGLRLGMSPDQVRVVIKSKGLLDYYESAQSLNRDPLPGTQLPAGSRFVNTIAAWTSVVTRASAAAGESYEVMFTPVPGEERAMSIVHSVSYSSESAVREMTVASGLVKKYGGYSSVTDLPESPTWRMQTGGNMLVGDSCNRRAVVGGLRELDAEARGRQNLALKTTPEEFQYQIDHCGVAIVTEDHTLQNGGASRQERTVRRFTVTAYSPSIGLDGATGAMQMMQTVRNGVEKAKTLHAKDQPEPNL